jgi:hypothetical protein
MLITAGLGILFQDIDSDYIDHSINAAINTTSMDN